MNTVKLIAIITFLTGGGSAIAAVPLTGPEYSAKADQLIKAYADKDQFSGTVLISVGDQTVLKKSYGLANREWNIPASDQTVYRIASITKQFTAALILKYQEEGKLKIDDTIGKYYPDAPASWSKVTIKHLLNHRSGIPSYTGLPGFMEGQVRIKRTPTEIIKLTQDKPLSYAPGTQYKYNNTGYALLGYVIEKISGKSYAEAVSEKIFKPLNLNHTYYETNEIIPQRASGYSQNKGRVVTADYVDMSMPYAAGSLNSTVEDLRSWQSQLFSGKFISQDSLKLMLTDYGSHYGFGMSVGDVAGHKVWAHNGGISGFSAHQSYVPDVQLSVTLLSNRGDFPISSLNEKLDNLYLTGNPEGTIKSDSSAALKPVLQKFVDELLANTINYDVFVPSLAKIIQEHHQDLREDMKNLGTLRGIDALGRTSDGELYRLEFDGGLMMCVIHQNAEGKIDGFRFRPN